MSYKQIKTEAEKYKELFGLPEDIATKVICRRTDLPEKMREAMQTLSEIKALFDCGSKEYTTFNKVINGSNVIPF